MLIEREFISQWNSLQDNMFEYNLLLYNVLILKFKSRQELTIAILLSVQLISARRCKTSISKFDCLSGIVIMYES